jgi:hypothetical protein
MYLARVRANRFANRPQLLLALLHIDAGVVDGMPPFVWGDVVGRR